MSKLTIQDVLQQAHDTFALVHENEDRDLNELTDEDLDELWDFAFTTYQAAAEEEELDFTLEQLEEAFNQPMGCPT